MKHWALAAAATPVAQTGSSLNHHDALAPMRIRLRKTRLAQGLPVALDERLHQPKLLFRSTLAARSGLSGCSVSQATPQPRRTEPHDASHGTSAIVPALTLRATSGPPPTVGTIDLPSVLKPLWRRTEVPSPMG